MSISKVKILVLKKMNSGEIREEYGRNVQECTDLKIGDEFIVENLCMPNGFCSWAWADIQRDVVHLALGGDFPWIKKKGTTISCCTDGLRPVVFKIERTE